MYQEFTPSPWMSQYVEAYWVYANRTNTNQDVHVLPDGCSDIIYSYEDNKHEVKAAGIMTTPIVANILPRTVMLGIRFKPGFATTVIRHPLEIITDKICHASEVTDVDINYFSESIITGNYSELPEKLENSFKPIVREEKIDYIATGAAKIIIDSNGYMPIESVARHVNISKRQLERKFMNTIGISPKMFSRVMRFNHANNLLKSRKDETLANIALNAGYYDQAHFCREFKEFSGNSPLKSI